MGRRRLAIGLFFGGVAAAMAFASILAAYDLWGGVPRSLWRVMRILLSLALGGIVLGAVGYLTSYEPAERAGAARKALLALAALGAVGGGGLFAYYAARIEPSRQICEPARRAPSLEARRRALREGQGPLFPVIDPHYECNALKRELDALDARGSCPTFPPTDAPCRCGNNAWRPGASHCTSGPTTCQYRRSARATGLGCAEGEAAETENP